MNEILTAMSSDMGINRYKGELDDSFFYRICYSALGLWCLHIAQNSSDGTTGTTKHNQTIVMNELLQSYAQMFPKIADKFTDDDNPQVNLSVHIRRVYEESGYLQTDKNNLNRLANFGRNIPMGHTFLFIGLPNKEYNINGLGVFTSPTTPSSSIREFLIRDELTYEEYFQERYDITNFYERDIIVDELQFFNPLSASTPSRSWSAKMVTDCSIARKSELGPYFRVIRESRTSLLFADEVIDTQRDSLTSYEYRRLIFALKAHYNNPLNAWIIRKDEEYSELTIGGHLPNREYYYLLLISWPIKHAFDKIKFLIRNDFIREVTDTLKYIGVLIKGGNADA